MPLRPKFDKYLYRPKPSDSVVVPSPPPITPTRSCLDAVELHYARLHLSARRGKGSSRVHGLRLRPKTKRLVHLWEVIQHVPAV